MLAELLCATRRAHPQWGPKKLLQYLKRRHRCITSWPAISTVGDLLVREGLVTKRRRRRRAVYPGAVLPHTTEPNDRWAADCEGQFRTGHGVHCYPLAITDQHAHCLLTCHCLRNGTVTGGTVGGHLLGVPRSRSADARRVAGGVWGLQVPAPGGVAALLVGVRSCASPVDGLCRALRARVWPMAPPRHRRRLPARWDVRRVAGARHRAPSGLRGAGDRAVRSPATRPSPSECPILSGIAWLIGDSSALASCCSLPFPYAPVRQGARQLRIDDQHPDAKSWRFLGLKKSYPSFNLCREQLLPFTVFAVRPWSPRRLALNLALVVGFAHAGSAQNSALDSVRIARLSSLGRLWGVVTYFHPALAAGGGDWDANTAIAIDAVRAATSRAEYSTAVSRLLATLHDPATRLVDAPPPTSVTPPVVSATWRGDGADSVLILRIPEFTNRSTRAVRQAATAVSSATRLVIDLRGAGLAGAGAASALFEAAGLDSSLASTPVAMPPMQRRLYNGFPSQSGTTTGSYWSGTYEQAYPDFPAGRGRTGRGIAFLVSSESDIPDIAFALHESGRATLVVDGDSRTLAATAEEYQVSLGEGLRAAIRVGELLNTAGDTAVARADGGDAPLSTALAVVRRGVAPSRPTTRPTMPTAPAHAESEQPFPSVGYRILAAYQWWNTIHYFYPYLTLTGENWDAVLPAGISTMEAARDSMEYVLGVATMATSIHDSHGFIDSPTMERHYGTAYVAAHLQYIDGLPVVVAIGEDSATRRSGLAVGDVIVRVDGESAAAKRARLAPYIPHSTPQSLDALVARGILSGAAGTARVTVRDARGRLRELAVPRTPEMLQFVVTQRSGPILRLLPGNIGYADLDRLTVSMVDSMFTLFQHTHAIIFDDRGYPNGTVWAIASRLTEHRNVAGARFDRRLVMSPDSTTWTTTAFVQYLPATTKPRYHGKTVVLVDERSLSQAEHTVLFLEAANRTRIVGSPTMGANGDVTNVALPGGITVNFTGMAVRHADGRVLQRVGIQPDIIVRPTLKGVRAGRDEVLERAIRYLRSITAAKQ